MGAEASIPPQYYKNAADVEAEAVAKKDAAGNKDTEPKRPSYPVLNPNDNIDDILGIG